MAPNKKLLLCLGLAALGSANPTYGDAGPKAVNPYGSPKPNAGPELPVAPPPAPQPPSYGPQGDGPPGVGSKPPGYSPPGPVTKPTGYGPPEAGPKSPGYAPPEAGPKSTGYGPPAPGPKPPGSGPKAGPEYPGSGPVGESPRRCKDGAGPCNPKGPGGPDGPYSPSGPPGPAGGPVPGPKVEAKNDIPSVSLGPTKPASPEPTYGVPGAPTAATTPVASSKDQTPSYGDEKNATRLNATPPPPGGLSNITSGSTNSSRPGSSGLTAAGSSVAANVMTVLSAGAAFAVALFL